MISSENPLDLISNELQERLAATVSQHITNPVSVQCAAIVEVLKDIPVQHYSDLYTESVPINHWESDHVCDTLTLMHTQNKTLYQIMSLPLYVAITDTLGHTFTEVSTTYQQFVDLLYSPEASSQAQVQYDKSLQPIVPLVFEKTLTPGAVSLAKAFDLPYLIVDDTEMYDVCVSLESITKCKQGIFTRYIEHYTRELNRL